MEMSKAEYSQLVQSLAPKSKTPKNCLNAFWVGGSICLLGQLLMNGFQALGLDRELSGTAVSVCLSSFRQC